MGKPPPPLASPVLSTTRPYPPHSLRLSPQLQELLGRFGLELAVVEAGKDRGLLPIQALAHELESLLDAARQHKLALCLPIIAVILANPGAPAAETAAPAGAGASAVGFVKVDTTKLDALIDLVGELVISESMVVQDPELLKSPSRNLARNLGQLRRITSAPRCRSAWCRSRPPSKR
jgi:chemotaxis protein histidine kinase CheA